MRVGLLVFLLLLVPAFAGCAGGGSLQWAGIAHAYQYRTSSLVEMQLHVARGVEPATEQTALAGMSDLVSLEDVVATYVLPLGTQQETLTDLVFDRPNATITAKTRVTGFDGFHVNATFVLSNGTKLRTHNGVTWNEVFSRPFHGTMNVVERDGRSTVTLGIFEVEEGATTFVYLGEVAGGTMSPIAISGVEAWHLRVTGTNGTVVEETTPATVNAATLSAVLPYGDIAQAEARFTLLLSDGTRITQRDVDGDAWPLQSVTQRERTQQN